MDGFAISIKRESFPATSAFADTDPVCSDPKAKIRPNEDDKVYTFAHPGRQPGNPGHLKSEAATYPSEPLP
jgi:hypothetical protein